jgi:hypothetical protein
MFSQSFLVDNIFRLLNAINHNGQVDFCVMNYLIHLVNFCLDIPQKVSALLLVRCFAMLAWNKTLPPAGIGS